MRIAVITMVYNERVMLPIWRRYYGAAFGPENLFILDHGSNDGSTDNLTDENRIKLYRDRFSNADRAKLISKFHETLLAIYDYVIYTDCDEFLVADPKTGKNLKAFIEARKRPYFTPVGLNLTHVTQTEPILDTTEPILKQRRHVQFVSPMMKTLTSSVPVTWKAGFHSSTLHPFIENDLFLFHLKRYDLNNDLTRTKITREIVRPVEEKHHGAHQRYSDDELRAMYATFSKMGVRPENEFDFSNDVATFQKSVWFNHGYYSGKSFRSDVLYKVPQRFESVF